MARVNNPNNIDPRGGSLLALRTNEMLNAGAPIRLANEDGRGHVQTVKTVYKPRRLKSAVTSVKDCDTGPYQGYIEESFDPSNFSQISFSVPEDQVRFYERMYSELVALSGARVPNPGVLVGDSRATTQVRILMELAAEMQAQQEAMVQAINTDILTIATAAAGNWQGGAATKTYQVQNADGSIYAKGLQDFRQDLQKINFGGTPHVIAGFGALDRIKDKDSRYFGLAANGINFDAVSRMTDAEFGLFIDQNVNEVLGDENDAIIIYPGSLILTPVPQYVGNFGKIGL
jgi:hypothetical protein